MQQVIKFDERLLATIAELQPVGLMELAKVAQRVDVICYTDIPGAYTHVAILDALGLDVSLGVWLVDYDAVLIVAVSKLEALNGR